MSEEETHLLHFNNLSGSPTYGSSNSTYHHQIGDSPPNDHDQQVFNERTPEQEHTSRVTSDNNCVVGLNPALPFSSTHRPNIEDTQSQRDRQDHSEPRSVNAERQANAASAFCNTIKKHWICCSFLTTLAVIVVVCGTIAGSIFAAQPSSSTGIFPGDVVQVLSLKYFWFNEAKISQEAPEGVQQSNTIIYLENCNSKERQDTLPFLSRPLPYTLPEGLFHLQRQYLLAHSSLEINVTAYVHSDSNANAKICQFSNANDYGRLLAADSKKQLDAAEMKGSCQSIEPPSNTTPLVTKMHFDIRSHGYYYYALAVDLNKQINMSYNYTLYRWYYNREELTPYNCSVENQDCVIKKLTTQRRDTCILAFIPTSGAVEPSLSYTFTSRQSHPYGILIVFLAVVFFFVGIFLLCYAFGCAYIYIARVRKWDPILR